MKEMKTLTFGDVTYETVDAKARENIETLQADVQKLDSEKASIESLSEVENKLDETTSVAKGANKALSYGDYSTMITNLNALSKDSLIVGQNIMIITLEVPDLWVSEIAEESVEYTYTSDEDFVVDLSTDGVVQVGYYVLSPLETQKVNLEEYVKNTDYASKDVAGVVKVNKDLAHGLTVTGEGLLLVKPASKSNIDARNPSNIDRNPITTQFIDYAVKKALSDCKLTGDDVWTDEEKLAVATLLNVLNLSNLGSGFRIDSLGKLQIHGGALNETLIKAKATNQIAITPYYLDLAVKYGLADSKIEWSDAEKASALELLGGVQKVADKSTYHQVYGKSADGTSQWCVDYTSNPTAMTIAQRGVGGVLPVGTPTEDTHATTKKYVDDLVGDVQTILTELHAYAETLSGGDA